MICIVIPTYNEKENIIKLVNFINKLRLNSKIIVVDDSKKKIARLKNIKNVKYLFRGKKLGRGSAVLHGFEEFLKNKNNKVFVEMDADFSHDPKEIKINLLYFYKHKLNFLISSRYLKKSKIKNWPILRKILSRLANLLARFLLGVPITDYTNGFRIYDRRAVKHILKKCKSSTQGFIILSEIIIELYNSKFKIGEIDSVFINRIRGLSKATFFEIFKSLIGIFQVFLKKRLFKF